MKDCFIFICDPERATQCKVLSEVELSFNLKYNFWCVDFQHFFGQSLYIM